MIFHSQACFKRSQISDWSLAADDDDDDYDDDDDDYGDSDDHGDDGDGDDDDGVWDAVRAQIGGWLLSEIWILLQFCNLDNYASCLILLDSSLRRTNACGML